jgi:hypothetical protein
MDPAEAHPTVDDDGLFPSGPWRGYYTYASSPARHRMDLHLTFKDGHVEGEGTDDVGPFQIAGTYDRESLEVRWTKTYPGSHLVHYRGFREGRGIWGTWHITAWSNGGFRIWPAAQGDEAALETEYHEEETTAVPARPVTCSSGEER